MSSNESWLRRPGRMKWRRRSLLSGLAALPVLAWTQTGRSVRVGILGATTAAGFGSHWAAFKKVQLELGWVEGRDLLN